MVCFVVFSCLFRLACTENPFFKEDTIVPANREIRGRVVLSDYTRPDGVFVWLEGFDINTRTDEDGRFRITLPSSSSQPGGGLNGVFKLYFYVANYRLGSVAVVVLKGNVQDFESDIGEDGELRQTHVLSKLLHIRISVDPASIVDNQRNTVRATVTLWAEDDSVVVNLPRMGKDELAVGFLEKVNADEAYVKLVENGDYVPFVDTVRADPQEWYLDVHYEPGMCPPGDYLVIPYLLVEQTGIPPELMSSLGVGVSDFSPSYLNIPFKREGGELSIVPF